MIVCICQGVSDRVVRLAVAGGATTVDAVAARCGAGTDCGSCRHAIQDLVHDFIEDVKTGSMSGSMSCDADGGSGPCQADASSSVAAGV